MTDQIAKPTAEDLVAGQRYRVEFDDCCVQGHFVGRFVEVRSVIDTDGELFAEAIVFDVGELAPVDWGQWTITEEWAP